MALYSFAWGSSRYLRLGPDLGLDEFQWLDDAPDEWEAPTAFRLSEEGLVTLLLLLVRKILPAEGLVPYGRSGRYWGEADLLARDQLGRIHLFECKPARLTPEDADQLATYSLATLFADAEDHVRYRLSRRSGDMLGIQLSKYMAATLTNVSDYTLRRETVRKYAVPYDGPAAEACVDAARWDRFWSSLTERERNPLRLRALRNRAVAHGWPEGRVPTVEQYLSLSSRWSEQLPEPPMPLFKPERPAVLWLVAPSFDVDVDERILRWRAEQVDARLMEFEVRADPKTATVLARVRTEHLPARDRVLTGALAWGQSHTRAERMGGDEPYSAPRNLRLRLYHRKRASDRGKTDDHGCPLPEQEMRAELVDWDDQKFVIAGVQSPNP